mmetsp:Transcript_25874/g.102031  ORF Transcript_25874/g.102031 Transcript_25874/m.102031 type:complete len:350 (+) Transcript_25874:141-1190(+)
MMRSPHSYGTPSGQDHHVSFAPKSPGGSAGAGGSRTEQLPNFILSSGYTPPSRAGMDPGKASPKEAYGNLLGASHVSIAPNDVEFNERLRSNTKSAGESGPGISGTSSDSRRTKRDTYMPNNSMLDESSQAQAFPVGPDSHGYPGSGPSSTPRRDSATQGSGGGLFDYDRSSPATSRGTTSASRTRFNLPSPAGSMGTPDAETADRWVTVFGFGQSMQSLILREFRNHGEIVRHVSGKGNWMHILYRTALQAQVALSRRVRLVGGETLVGVIEYSADALSPDLSGTTDQRPSSILGSGGASTPAGVGAIAGQSPGSQPGVSRYSPASLPASGSMKTPRPRRSFWQSGFQ